jgi:hypothetical protein
MEWQHSDSSRPFSKNSELKNQLQKFSPRFFGIKLAYSSFLSSKWSNYQREVLLISAGATERHLKEKRHGKFTNVVLFLHDNVPSNRALATQKKLAYLGLK